MDIQVGIVGRVANSERPGHFIRVQDDRDNTSGFLVFEWWDGSDGPNPGSAFDTRVENEADLRALVEQAGWQIDWDQP
jgi:hypothetical protein